MKGKHALMISVAVGIAAIAGAIAATKTTHLGRSAAVQPAAASSAIAHRTRQLDRAEVALRKALTQRPPKLPPLPAATPRSAAGGPVRQQRVVYVRPAPIVHTVHRAGSHEGDHEPGDGGESSGGGFDD